MQVILFWCSKNEKKFPPIHCWMILYALHSKWIKRSKKMEKNSIFEKIPVSLKAFEYVSTITKTNHKNVNIIKNFKLCFLSLKNSAVIWQLWGSSIWLVVLDWPGLRVRFLVRMWTRRSVLAKTTTQFLSRAIRGRIQLPKKPHFEVPILY